VSAKGSAVRPKCVVYMEEKEVAEERRRWAGRAAV
jgi:hypothetical protein